MFRTLALLSAAAAAAAAAALPPTFRITIFQPAAASLLPSKASLAAALRSAVAAAAAAGSSLLVCPELYSTGYNPAALLGGEPRGGPSYAAAAALAREFNISLAYTYTESEGGRLYDSAALFNRSGAAVADYRKVNLAGDGEALVFAPGAAFAPVAEIDGVRVGLLICFDVFLPEPARILALRGADLVLVPTANGYPGFAFNSLAQLIVPARALENNAFFVYTNWFQAKDANSSDFPGIFSFFGQSVVASAGGGILYTGPNDRGALAHVDLNFTGYTPGGTAQARPAADTQGLCEA